jgi:CubicO group peptidase (beta-lactamase class C family)
LPFKDRSPKVSRLSAEVFRENFARRHELGAACCIYYKGKKVVDLWGGIRNKITGEPWEEATMVCVFSTAKGMSGLVMALAHSRGLLDYEESVCTYWPEFAQNGKEKITVRQLLSHQAGLFAFDITVDKNVVSDLDRLAVVFVLTAVYERTTGKYGDRGIRYVHIEVGHAAQNLCPQATAMGLGAVTVGAFHDEEVAKLLNLPQDEHPLYIIPVGRKQ